MVWDALTFRWLGPTSELASERNRKRESEKVSVELHDVSFIVVSCKSQVPYMVVTMQKSSSLHGSYHVIFIQTMQRMQFFSRFFTMLTPLSLNSSFLCSHFSYFTFFLAFSLSLPLSLSIYLSLCLSFHFLLLLCRFLLLSTLLTDIVVSDVSLLCSDVLLICPVLLCFCFSICWFMCMYIFPVSFFIWLWLWLRLFIARS